MEWWARLRPLIVYCDHRYIMLSAFAHSPHWEGGGSGQTLSPENKKKFRLSESISEAFIQPFSGQFHIKVFLGADMQVAN